MNIKLLSHPFLIFVVVSLFTACAVKPVPSEEKHITPAYNTALDDVLSKDTITNSMSREAIAPRDFFRHRAISPFSLAEQMTNNYLSSEAFRKKQDILLNMDKSIDEFFDHEIIQNDSRSFNQDIPNTFGFEQNGYASWYGKKFQGHRTANGEHYNKFALTAAHRTLPLSSFVRVTNLTNHKSVIVKINDRGPFHKNRILDLSYSAAKKLDFQKKGIERVKIEGLSNDELNRALKSV